MAIADITATHPEYDRFSKRWEIMDHALGDQDDIKDAGEKYLPATSGMKDGVVLNDKYDAYRCRARFPEITSQALTAMTGLIFENEPEGASDEIITNSGQNNVEFARDVIRACASKGRDVLVVDAPEDGGDAFIARYAAVSFTNWKAVKGRPSDILLGVFKESSESSDAGLYGHETEDEYRQYLRTESGIELSRWRIVDGTQTLIAEPRLLAVPFMPIIAVGSIDSVPSCDPIPLLPVARCAIAAYQLSADYRGSMHVNGNPTPYQSGGSEEQYEGNRQAGIGTGSFMYVPEGGSLAFLETSGSDHASHRQAIEDELRQAETYAVRLTQNTDQAESGTALARRAQSQHASIYTIADSVSIAITMAQRMRAQWNGRPEPEPFKLDATVDEEVAAAQMMTAINNLINSGNAPRSAAFELTRKAKLSQKTDEEMEDEIGNQSLALPETI